MPRSFDLLPRKLALRVKSETIILAEVPHSEVERLETMPAVNVDYENELLSSIYMLPPIRYPDGRYYVKMGCNNVFDQTLSSLGGYTG